MGCLFKSFGFIMLLAIILPILLLVSLFGRIKNHTKTSDTSDNSSTPFNQPQEEEQQQDNSNVPIDSNTIEYVEFEEIKDNENNTTQ